MLFTNHPVASIRDRRFITLGTDGFGRSDTRAALRAFFGVDAKAIAKAAKFALEG
jgi:pyruvate dehydrogenase E1 component